MSPTKDKRVWLDAYDDPVADLHSFSGGICLAEDRLVVGDLSGWLKVVDGNQHELARDVKLHGVPSAVCSFYDTNSAHAGAARVAVASGPDVFVFCRMSPFFKVSLDAEKVPQLELDVWEKLRSGALDPARACEVLREHKRLSERSLELLALENDRPRLDRYVAQELEGNAFREPIQTCITCMETLRLTQDESDSAPSLLVIGTESRKLVLLDPGSREVVKSFSLRSEPVFLAVSGSVNVEYRIAVACRDKRIYSIKSGAMVRNCIELETHACGGLVRCGRELIVGGVDKTLHAYHIKGKRSWTMRMPERVTNVAPFRCARAATEGFLVALRNGEVRLYIDKTLMATIHNPGQVVTAMQFGQMNREANTLAILFTSGALSVKMLKRTAKLDATKAPTPGPPAEQDVPLPVPKKTKLYVDQAQRERDAAADMHLAFQGSLSKLRYMTARSYLRMFQHSGSANSQMYSSANHFIRADDTKERVNVSVSVLGIGPQFRLSLRLDNVGSLPVVGAAACLLFSLDAYHVDVPRLQLPALLPHVAHHFEVVVHSLAPGAEAPPIHISVVRGAEALLHAQVDMPVAEAA